MSNSRSNPIVSKSYAFAIQIIKYCDELDSQKKYILSKQLFRSGTSIGANVKEAQQAESRADFIHKMKISLKEAEETEYWLMLCNDLEAYPDTKQLSEELTEIKKLLTSIVVTSKSRQKGH